MSEQVTSEGDARGGIWDDRAVGELARAALDAERERAAAGLFDQRPRGSPLDVVTAAVRWMFGARAVR